MPALELWLSGLRAVGLSLAACTLFGDQRRRRSVLLVATLVFLSASAMVAAAHQAEMLVYIGLAAGGFVAASCWEGGRAGGLSREP